MILMAAKRILLLVGLLVWVLNLMAQEPRTRPRPERLIESNAPGEFIIADSSNDGQWNPNVIWNDTVMTLNGDTVVVFPIPGVTPQTLSIDSTGAAVPRTFTICISDGNCVSFQDLGGGVGGMNSWTFVGDSGTTETVTDGELVTFIGGDGS